MVTSAQPAGFWRRLAAWLIDGIIVSIPGIVILLLTMGNFAPGSFMKLGSYGLVIQAIWLLAAIAYYVGFISSRWQATPGKRAMQVYIVHASDQQPIDAKRALARYVVFNFPTLFFLILSPFLMHMMPMPPQTAAMESPQMQAIWHKQMARQPLTAEEQQFLQEATIPQTLPGLSEGEQQQYALIRSKTITHQPLTHEESQFFAHATIKTAFSGPMLVLQGLNLVMFIYMTALALTIGCTREKKGFHDMLCKTRAVQGRI